MNQNIFSCLQFFFCAALLVLHTCNAEEKSVDKKITTHVDDATGLLVIDYQKEPLTNIIYFLQDLKKINIIPTHGSAAIKETVTFKTDKKITIDEFYQWFVSILDQVGYIITQRPNALLIGQKNAESLREPVNILINTTLDEIPNTDEMIRYIYYLENTKISLSTDAEFNVLVKEFLSPTGLFRVDINANAYIMADRASNIKTVVRFLNELDKPTQQEQIGFIHLVHTEAAMVAAQLQELINTKSSGVEQDPQLPKGIINNRKQSDLLFFAKGTKIFPILHNNTIMLIGRQQDIDEIKKFVKEHIDQAIGSGIPTLHTHQLQYIDATNLAPTLQKVVSSSRAGGTGQSEATGANNQVKGNERLLNDCIIQSDRPENPETRQYYGGNNLIFGCTQDDFEQMKQLIAELDVPPSLILLEIAIADLSLEDSRLLGAITRSPEKLALLSAMQFQTAQVGPGIVLDNLDAPTTIHSDLLANTTDSDGKFVSPTNATQSIAATAPPGSTVISLNDQTGKTWSMLQILKLFSSSKIIQHPHIITVDNKQALVSIGESRLLNDETTNSASGVAVQQTKEVRANLNIVITPRKAGNDGSVSMKIDITIDDFKDSQGTKTVRATNTTVNVKSGSIFAISGLSQVNKNDATSKVPLLGDIPLLGWLGKKQTGNTNESSLTIFISPTIIEPRLREGIGDHTQAYVNIARNFSQESTLFDSAKDPITRWFFSNQPSHKIENSLESFITKSSNKKLLNPSLTYQIEEVEMPSIMTAENKKEDLKSMLTTIEKNPFAVEDENTEHL